MLIVSFFEDMLSREVWKHARSNSPPFSLLIVLVWSFSLTSVRIIWVLNGVAEHDYSFQTFFYYSSALFLSFHVFSHVWHTFIRFFRAYFVVLTKYFDNQINACPKCCGRVIKSSCMNWKHLMKIVPERDFGSFRRRYSNLSRPSSR